MEEKVIFVQGGDLEEVNKLLAKGWTVQEFKPVVECVPESGNSNNMGTNVCAYFILEKSSYGIH